MVYNLRPLIRYGQECEGYFVSFLDGNRRADSFCKVMRFLTTLICRQPAVAKELCDALFCWLAAANKAQEIQERRVDASSKRV